MVKNVDQKPSLMHFCRICKIGYGCGGPLRGHRIAHGIEDEMGRINEEGPTSNSEDKAESNKLAHICFTNQYQLVQELPSLRKLWYIKHSSWKCFLEHGKCSLLNDLVSVSPMSSHGSEVEGVAGRKECVWLKGKRSRREKMRNYNVNCLSSEEEELANCLVMLSNGRLDPLVAVAGIGNSCASASKEDRWYLDGAMTHTRDQQIDEKAKGVVKRMFECKPCKKVFNSPQALGGHRASHKKANGCIAAKITNLYDNSVEEDVMINHEEFLIPSASNAAPPLHQNPAKRTSKVHECSICHRVFQSGQALGGHKRCHCLTTNFPDTSFTYKFHKFQDDSQQLYKKPIFRKSEPLDLNLPAAAVDEIVGIWEDPDNPLIFEVPTAIYQQPQINGDTDNRQNHHQHNNTSASMHNVNGTEADSEDKLVELSDLKDMDLGGGSSPWLQMGIASTTYGRTNPEVTFNV